MGSLATRQPARAFPPGIHVPSLTWFKDDEAQTIDWSLQESHLKFLIESGLHGSKCPSPAFESPANVLLQL